MRKSMSLLPVLLLAMVMSSLAQRRPVHPKLPSPRTVALASSSRPSPKKYNSLLWEISGNGLKKPSYLFGTMHVSDKLAFHLGDSFYTAIKSADIVALETNPESWQDDYSQSVFFRGRRSTSNLLNLYANRWEWPSDHMRITTFAIDRYEEAIKAALAVEPSMINGMLYRTYGRQSEDFEEDTFLDMYIFQTGKKLGKRVSGVENFQESEKLVMEAYKAMVRDQNKKRRSYDYEGMMTNPKKVEDAYRKGDLDLLDSLENLTVFSDAFQEKFLYRRNEIQANSIDSIVKKMSLFVGVGAAHLPGRRGVIELLRQKGYTLRPVHMDDRNSLQKESVDKIRISNTFTTQTADDGFYSVSIPGKKFYRFTDWNGMDVVQYADMVNGAYYMVTRIKTNSLPWGHSSETVYKKIDSLLYENIPGKILKKAPIIRNGYKGLDITNRTRRGDCQRYQIFVTPFEILIFKMSGNGEYVIGGDESQKFFGSVHMKEYTAGNWLTWQPPTGGFTVQMPHTPSLLKDNSFGTDRLEYAARDESTGNDYLIMKVNLHNYSFIEEDSFELNLMDESYGYSDFIDKQLSHHFASLNGYPMLESKYRHKDGSFSSAKYIIQGPIYYAVIAHYKNDNANAQRFMQSFAITPFIYPAPKPQTDTVLKISVTSPIYTDANKKDDAAEGIEAIMQLANGAGDDDNDDYNFPSFGTRLIGNDTIGEKVLITHFQVPEYSYKKDSTELWKTVAGNNWFSDTSFIVKENKQYTLPNGMRCRDVQLTDTNSSRLLLARLFYKNGHFFSISTLTDSLTPRSALLTSFFSTFKPADTLKGESLFTRKTPRFFHDLLGKDSVANKKARRALYQVAFDSLDVPLIKSAIEQLNWNTKDYLSLKKYFIESLGTLKDSSIAPWLQKLYWKVKDTTDWQSAILNALLNQRTKASFLAFKDLVLQEPPITDDDVPSVRGYKIPAVESVTLEVQKYTRRNSSAHWAPLYDSLPLTKVIFPDILQLMNIDDYRTEIMNLLVTMVDSGDLQSADYETYFPKIYLEAKQLLRKQMAKENKIRMEKEEASKDAPASNHSNDEDDDDEVSDAGNSELDHYAILLEPFLDKNPGVQTFFEQLMKTQDRRLLYNTFTLLLRNDHKVPDSLFMKYAQVDEYRSELYDDLEKMKKTDKFPHQYKNQLAISKGVLIKMLNSYDKIDTLIFLDKLPVTYDHKKGFVYFFKYKRMHDDVVWQLASVGPQPEKSDVIDVENDDFTTTDDDRKLDNDKPVKEQLQKMLKEMLYARRNSASVFYDARSYSMYKNYLSEMVKNQRYRD